MAAAVKTVGTQLGQLGTCKTHLKELAKSVQEVSLAEVNHPLFLPLRHHTLAYVVSYAGGPLLRVGQAVDDLVQLLYLYSGVETVEQFMQSLPSFVVCVDQQHRALEDVHQEQVLWVQSFDGIKASAAQATGVLQEEIKQRRARVDELESKAARNKDKGRKATNAAELGFAGGAGGVAVAGVLVAVAWPAAIVAGAFAALAAGVGVAAKAAQSHYEEKLDINRSNSSSELEKLRVANQATQVIQGPVAKSLSSIAGAMNQLVLAVNVIKDDLRRCRDFAAAKGTPAPSRPGVSHAAASADTDMEQLMQLHFSTMKAMVSDLIAECKVLVAMIQLWKTHVTPLHHYLPAQPSLPQPSQQQQQHQQQLYQQPYQQPYQQQYQQQHYHHHQQQYQQYQQMPASGVMPPAPANTTTGGYYPYPTIPTCSPTFYGRY